MRVVSLFFLLVFFTVHFRRARSLPLSVLTRNNRPDFYIFPKNRIICDVFRQRSEKLERIDTGHYTNEEYEVFLREIRFINRYLGDSRALRKTLFREIEKKDLREFSVLDVGAGSGELLRQIAVFAARTGKQATLAGLDLNEISAAAIRRDCADFPNIATIRGDALTLPLADNSYDYAISSLFFHHLTNDQIVVALKEMSRVARRGIFVIDLHRHRAAYALYQLFCIAFRISALVREDGSLSILRGFKPSELQKLSSLSGLRKSKVERKMPLRLVMCVELTTESTGEKQLTHK